MRTPIARNVLLALAVALAACTSETAERSLGPSDPNLVRSSKSNDTKSKHIHGRLETTESGVLVPGTPLMLRHLEGTGNASHLGRFTVVGDLTLNLATASGFGRQPC